MLKPTFRYEYQGNLKKLTFGSLIGKANEQYQRTVYVGLFISNQYNPCLLYTSDAADERSSVDLGGRRIIKKKNK